MPYSSPSDALRHDPCQGDKQRVRPALYLDYGADCVSGEDAACELCSRGMRFRSTWRFEIGSLIKIALRHTPTGESSAERLEVEAMVVDSVPVENSAVLLTTLAFIDPPETLRSALGEVSARLLLD